MKPSEIEVGEIYAGRNGKRRFVCGIDMPYVEFQRDREKYRDAPDSFMLLSSFARWADQKL